MFILDDSAEQDLYPIPAPCANAIGSVTFMVRGVKDGCFVLKFAGRLPRPVSDQQQFRCQTLIITLIWLPCLCRNSQLMYAGNNYSKMMHWTGFTKSSDINGLFGERTELAASLSVSLRVTSCAHGWKTCLLVQANLVIISNRMKLFFPWFRWLLIECFDRLHICWACCCGQEILTWTQLALAMVIYVSLCGIKS